MSQYYSQRDIRWNNEMLGFGTSTIGSVGCYLVALCSGLNEKGYSFTPYTLNELLKQNQLFTGEFNNYINVEALSSKLPNIFKGFQQIEPWDTEPALKDILKDNIIALGKVSGVPIGGSGSHFVLITGKNYNTAVIHDPWSNIEEKITKRWKNYGNIKGLRLFRVAPYQVPEQPDNNKVDFERAVEVLKKYRAERKQGTEGSWEGYVNAVIGSDKDMEKLQNGLTQCQDNLNKLKMKKVTFVFRKKLAIMLFEFAKTIEGGG